MAPVTLSDKYIPLLLTASTGFVAITASGFSFTDWSWLHETTHAAYRDLCHQLSSRSFFIDEHKMAVCTRCFGIYTGLFIMAAAGMLVPGIRKIGLKSAMLISAIAVFINVADVAGYAAGLWTNTGLSRYIAGALAGGSPVLIIYSALNRKH